MTILLAFILTTIGFVIGVVVGLAIEKTRHVEPIGDLRIDESDPEDGPYLFLELNARPDNIKTHKQVTLNVKVENFISQK